MFCMKHLWLDEILKDRENVEEQQSLSLCRILTLEPHARMTFIRRSKDFLQETGYI